MNILFVSCTYPNPNSRQRGSFNHTMVESLSEQHDVRVIAPIPWTETFGRRVRSDSPELVEHPTYFYPPKILRQQYGTFFWRSIQRSYRRLTSNWRPDLVLGYWTHPDGEAAVRIGSQLDVPVGVIVGGTDVRLRVSDPGRGDCIKGVLDRSDQVIAVSRELSDRIVELGVPSAKVKVIYRGVDKTIFKPGSRTKARSALDIDAKDRLFVWAGRLTEVKQPAHAIEAFACLALYADRPMHLAMIGEGKLLTELEKMARRLGLAKSVRFLPNMSQEKLATWYRASDLVLLTSRSEGIPNVLAEASACGIPFVASRVGGVPEIACSGVDHLVDELEPANYAMAINKCLNANKNHLKKAFATSDRIPSHRVMTEDLLRLFASKHDIKSFGESTQLRA